MLSLDIFDTLITRTIGSPSDAFFLLGMDLKRAGLVADPAKFCQDRIESERLARQRSVTEDVTLDEIYEVLCERPTYQHLNVAHLKFMELAVELALAQPVTQMVERFRTADRPPVLISDMYLSSGAIRELVNKALDNKGAVRDYHLFVSSEVGLTKNSGGLYQHVAEKIPHYREGGIHVGDKAYADVVVPNRMGFRSEHFTESSRNRFEQIVFDVKDSHPYFSLLSGCMRAARLANPHQASREKAIWDYSTSVAAPIVILFVQWILSQARSHGVSNLAFLARDGQIMCKVARHFASPGSEWPRCEYVLASRQAWNLPSVLSVPDDIEAWAFDDTDYLSVASFAARVGLFVSDFTPWLRRTGSSPNENLAREARSSLFSFLRGDEHLHHKIRTQAHEKRVLVLKYFRDAGVFLDESWAIVDVGWRGRLQQALERILITDQEHHSLRRAYYFSLQRPVDVVAPQSIFFSGSQINRGWVENIFAADHGSLHEFRMEREERVVPVFRPVPPQGALHWGVVVQHEAVLKVTELLAAAIQRFSVEVPSDTVSSNLVGHLVRAAVKKPSAHEAEIFAPLLTYEDQLESVGYPFIAKDLKLREVVTAALLRRPFRNGNEWQEASVALGPAHHRLLFDAITRARRVVGVVRRLGGN